MWIKRDISKILSESNDPIQVLRGPRQCGKSSLLMHIGPEFTELSFDDPALREYAQTDPERFLSQFKGQKIFIDEAQYAPNIFPSLKRRVDLMKREASELETIVRLSGSNQILMDKNVKESLAGRAAFFDLNTLSVAEILNATHLSIQEILFNGGWPELYAYPDRPTKRYLDSYIVSYIEKDIVLAAGIQKSEQFLKFTRLLAGRVGQLFDQSHFANEVGVDSKTIKEWLSVLSRMGIISLVPPYSSNLSSRLVKSPKVYFIDTGLAVRLQGWESSAPIATSPLQGALFENLVFSEIYKTNLNYQLGLNIFHWRSKDGEEVDFVLERGPHQHLLIEAKVTCRQPPPLDSFRELRKVFTKPKFLVCFQEGDRVIGDAVPISLLKSEL